MFTDRISDYFEGVAAKYLTAVDADRARSNQHEIGGLPAVGFKKYLGTPGKDVENRFDAKQVYITDESLAPEVVDGSVTWYDCRRKQPHRRPEYRLYYYRNAVTELLTEGDFLLIAKMRDDSLLMVFTSAGSSIESQLRALFGLDVIGTSFTPGRLDSMELLLPLRNMLEDLGLELNPKTTNDGYWLDRVVEKFGDDGFPSTAQFSLFARNTSPGNVDPFVCPDSAILDWMGHEEMLFRILERHLISKKLDLGFADDVESFISFSLSVQNRRKSRVGFAFEDHLDEIFKSNGLRYEQGRGKFGVTENNSRPDFLFPGFAEYRDPLFPDECLLMLGAKTTCKDRWRQVLSEADRISQKHLVTLEAAISTRQTSEMRAQALQLVVPKAIHSTYTKEQEAWLYSLSDFISIVSRGTRRVIG
ncbi:type II restriction endonuclease [Pseudomonas graminis]|uniref:EcoRII C terminal n=1 Tax=Pseudomonas graminis TaxID=158627 RepID=A0A1I0J4H2_9PSED|nr:type II restriction endonuclease [Pseudomonas graminis]SEU04634.1 EcoRII C terminal [Pseudomonas graminis]